MPLDGIVALFYRTPQEHLNGMWKIIKRLPPSPPPRSVPVCTCAQVVLTQFTFPHPIHDVHTDTSACMSTSAGHPAATKPSSSCATARSWGISRSIGRVGWRWHGSRRGGRSRGARWVVDAGYGWSRVTDGIAFLYPLCSFFSVSLFFPSLSSFPPLCGVLDHRSMSTGQFCYGPSGIRIPACDPGAHRIRRRPQAFWYVPSPRVIHYPVYSSFAHACPHRARAQNRPHRKARSRCVTSAFDS